MKIHILSDLHNEFVNFNPPSTNADIVIFAGDIDVGENGIKWVLNAFKNQKIIYVMGNHEYYHHSIPELTEHLRTLVDKTNIHILENDELIIENIRFLGCTFWSDFNLLNNSSQAINYAQNYMNDYRLIKLSGKNKVVAPHDTIKWHTESKLWLETKLLTDKNDNLKTIVITHNAISSLSVPERFKANPLTPAFASNMDSFILDKEIDLWVHGHTHDSFDYNIGQTRVICNPRGYHPHELNPDFNPNLIIDIN